MTRLTLSFLAFALHSCQSAPATPPSTNWQQLAKKFSTHHTARFQWDLIGLPYIIRGDGGLLESKYDNLRPLDPVDQMERYNVWMDLDKPWLVLHNGATKVTFPAGVRSQYISPEALKHQKPPPDLQVPPMIAGPITALLEVFASGFESCKVEAPALKPGTNHYGGSMVEWAKLDCKQLQKGFGNPLYLSYRVSNTRGVYPEVLYFETKAVKNVPSYKIYAAFSGIEWDLKFEDTIYSTDDHGDTFRRYLTPGEIVDGNWKLWGTDGHYVGWKDEDLPAPVPRKSFGLYNPNHPFVPDEQHQRKPPNQ